MKKVLIVITTAFVPTGGLTTVMMNYYRAMDKTGLRIDFASTNNPPQNLLDEIHNNGSEYYKLPKRIHLLSYFLALKNLSSGYDIIHINGNSATSALELVAANLAGTKIRIAHNHTSRSDHPLLNTLLKPIFLKSYTIGLACSEEAGSWLFGKKKFKVVNNAIDVNKYRFQTAIRKEYRIRLGIPVDAVVIGHVGKINHIKNHSKLIKVFDSFRQEHKNSFLLFVGDGPLRDLIDEQITNCQLNDRVIITGLTKDVPSYLCVMDVFVFPSKWEGFGLAIIEAEASGLPCLVSDRVPNDVFISKYVFSISLDESSEKWAQQVERMMIYNNRTKQSLDNIDAIINANYDVSSEADALRSLYLNY